MSELGDVLAMSDWLRGRGLSDEEHDDLMRFAKETRPPGVESFPQHLAIIVMSIDRGGERALRGLVELAREPKERREIRLQLLSWGRELLCQAVRNARGASLTMMHLEELRGRIAEKLRELWPTAHDAKIRGAVGTATQLRGGHVSIDWDHVVSAMSQPDVLLN